MDQLEAKIDECKYGCYRSSPVELKRGESQYYWTFPPFLFNVHVSNIERNKFRFSRASGFPKAVNVKRSGWKFPVKYVYNEAVAMQDVNAILHCLSCVFCFMLTLTTFLGKGAAKMKKRKNYMPV